MVHTKVVFEEGWSFIRGKKQCKPKHVSSGIVVFRVVSQEGDYCTTLQFFLDYTDFDYPDPQDTLYITFDLYLYIQLKLNLPNSADIDPS